MLLHSVRHDWPEKPGFRINRPEGVPYYTFLHFSTAIHFRFGDETVEALPGACIFYAPDVPQFFQSSGDVIHNWMHGWNGLEPLLEQFEIPCNCLLYPANTAFISEIFRKIEVEHFSSGPHKEELIDGYIREFLIKLSRALQRGTPPTVVSRSTREKLREVRQQILSQPEKKWNVAQMASLAALSPSRFHAIYKSLFATSPMQDLIDARVSYGRSLLLSDEELTLQEVAEKLGYNDQYHFIRQFKAVTGLTPGTYRKRHL